jgi:AcrR family transcriptional regulator
MAASSDSPGKGAPNIIELGSRSEETRLQILEGALRTFARIGFESASTRLIAAEAGVHHASLRYHFGDKESLWRTAISLMFERQREEFRQSQNEDPIDFSTLEGMKELVRRWVRYCAQHPEHAQILVHEAIADTPRLAWAIDSFVKLNSERFGIPLSVQAAAGNLRVPDPDLTAIILSSASQMTFVLSAHLRQVFGRDVSEPEFVEKLSDALIAMLFTR